MFRPVKMCKVNILVLAKHVTELTRRLGQCGLVHLIDAVSQSQDRLLKEVDQERDERTLENLISRCDRLIEALGVDSEAEPPTLGELNQDDIAAILSKIFSRFQEQDNAIRQLLRDSGSLTQESAILATYPLQQVKLEALRNLSHFYLVTGRLAPSVLPRAATVMGDRAVLVQADGQEGNVLVIASRKNRWAVEDELNKFGFTPVEPPETAEDTAAAAQEQMEDKLETLRRNIEECRRQVIRLSEEYGGILLAIRSRLRGLLAVRRAQQHFGRIAQLYCISGWTPRKEVDAIRKLVEENTDGTGVVEVIEAEDDILVKAGLEDVPVQFSGGSWLRPFQMLVANFGLPQYNEIDPSVFVAISFVVLFGFMFGDLGQGAVLAAIGFWLRRTKRSIPAFLRDSGGLLIGCGLSAALFGLAYGSVFGYENHHILPPLWLSPLNTNDITQLLATAVGVGIVFTSVAIIINIINRFLARRYFEGVFDRFGVLGLLFYWFALGAGITLLVTGKLAPWAIGLVVLPLVVLLLKGPIQLIVRRRQKRRHSDDEEEGILNIIIEACIELMETLTGYISGTVSFVRVGAFAISHAALCFAIYSIVGVLKSMRIEGALGGVLSIVIIIFGNIIVIAFEGMVAMIQGIRLEYYELFSKYFSGDGIAYDPFQIDEKNDASSTEPTPPA